MTHKAESSEIVFVDKQLSRPMSRLSENDWEALAAVELPEEKLLSPQELRERKSRLIGYLEGRAYIAAAVAFLSGVLGGPLLMMFLVLLSSPSLPGDILLSGLFSAVVLLPAVAFTLLRDNESKIMSYICGSVFEPSIWRRGLKSACAVLGGVLAWPAFGLLFTSLWWASLPLAALMYFLIASCAGSPERLDLISRELLRIKNQEAQHAALTEAAELKKQEQEILESIPELTRDGLDF